MARALIALGLAILGLCAQAGAAPGEIVVFVTVEPETFALGETVIITVKAQNIGGSPIEYGRGSSSCRLGAVVRVNDADLPVPDPRACLRDLGPWILAPGERRRERLLWTGAVAATDTTYQLPPGTYELRGAAGFFLSEPVEVEIRGTRE
jgi:hypothetical protein